MLLCGLTQSCCSGTSGSCHAVLDSFVGARRSDKELKHSQLLHDLAGGWCYELSERWRFDERIFEFLTWLRVDEPSRCRCGRPGASRGGRSPT